jgi:hypothetical protein
MATKNKSAPVKSIDLPIAIINNFLKIQQKEIDEKKLKEIVIEMILILKKNNIYMNLSKINKMGFNGYCSVCGRVTIQKGTEKSRQYAATYHQFMLKY